MSTPISKKKSKSKFIQSMGYLSRQMDKDMGLKSPSMFDLGQSGTKHWGFDPNHREGRKDIDRIKNDILKNVRVGSKFGGRMQRTSEGFEAPVLRFENEGLRMMSRRGGVLEENLMDDHRMGQYRKLKNNKKKYDDFIDKVSRMPDSVRSKFLRFILSLGR